MVARQNRPAQQERPSPPYFIAVEPLYLDGNQFARAHNVGDRVPAEHVEAYGWAGKVRHPDEPPAADQPHNEPETAEGQATTDGKGDA